MLSQDSTNQLQAKVRKWNCKKVSLVRLCGAIAFTTIRTATLADEELQFLTAAIRDEWKKPIYKRKL